MLRRNIIPDSVPVSTDGWNHSEANMTLQDFSVGPDGLHYKAIATATPCQGGILWNDASEITVRPNENYGLRIHIDTTTRPEGGLYRVLVLYKAFDGVTPATTWFGADMPDGVVDIEEVITAPSRAHRASVSILYTAVAGDTPDLVTPLEFTASEFLLEPLGPVVTTVFEGAVTNHATNGSVEYGTSDWLPHTHDDNTILPGTTWAVQNGWASDGVHSMRHRITGTDHVVVDGTMLHGFIGSYVGGLYFAKPGDVVTWECDTNVLEGPATGPGVFLELFFYHYDGIPENTVELLHLNSASFHQPLDIGVPHRQSMQGIAPEGTTVFQATVVMASEAPSEVMDFYADAAMVLINDESVPYFDGDSAEAGWTGLPGRSASRQPGVSVRVPGPYFNGDDSRAQWEGVHHRSMSTLRTPLIRRTADLQFGPTVNTMRLVTSTLAVD